MLRLSFSNTSSEMEQFNQALTYESNSSVQQEDGLHLINLLGINKGNKVLDLGCGTGYLTKVLADQVGQQQGKVTTVFL